MAEPRRELLNLASTVTFLEDSQDEKLYVKGFASAKTEDRGGDLVPPSEFKIKQFMSAPTLLINHKFWIDPRGNSVAVGKPVELHASKLVKLKDNSDDWGVKDLDSGEIVNTFPRSKMPNLSAGDEGLFVVAEVTQPEVKNMVERGELQAFSWRGLVNVDYQVNPDGTTSRVLTDIDLYEISLVNVPANPDATLIIGKTEGVTENLLPLVVHQVRLDREFFSSDGDALHYLKEHSLYADSIRSDALSHYSLQKSAAEFDLHQLVSVKLRDGVYAIAGPLLVDKASAFGGTGPMTGTREPDDTPKKSDKKRKKKPTSGGRSSGSRPRSTSKPAGTASDNNKWRKAAEQAVELAAKQKKLDDERKKLQDKARDLKAKRDAAIAADDHAEQARLEGELRENASAQKANAQDKADLLSGAKRKKSRSSGKSKKKPIKSRSSVGLGDKYKRDSDGQFASGNIGGPGRPKKASAIDPDDMTGEPSLVARLVAAAKSLRTL